MTNFNHTTDTTDVGQANKTGSATKQGKREHQSLTPKSE